MTVPPGSSAPGSLPAAGWYPDPAGSGWLQWWDGRAWTGQLSGPPAPGQSAQPEPRPRLNANTAVYNPYIWIIVALPVIPLIILLFWNPVIKVRTVGVRHEQTVDPASIFTAPYFLMVGTSLLAYAVTALMSYLDWDRLRRDGVVRPFHWAWVFLSREVYVIGRSVIVHQVAPRRGLAPVWATLAVTAATLVVASIKASALIAAAVGAMAT
ncbi:hypothetical protein AHiyo6_21740 [Arthrobacter sp. Hiyo6]|nr:hypothetical protein AHiyo6_21740 [Arthrobacter sp. Hiyo6]